jgi:hypothetical protein
MSHYEFYGKPFSFETRLGPWFAGRNNLTVINDVTIYHPARAIQMPALQPFAIFERQGRRVIERDRHLGLFGCHGIYTATRDRPATPVIPFDSTFAFYQIIHIHTSVHSPNGRYKQQIQTKLINQQQCEFEVHTSYLGSQP